MSQSKKQSLIEVCTSTGVGVVGSWMITMGALHFINDRIVAGTLTVLACTVWSLLRGYYIRRYFNGVITS